MPLRIVAFLVTIIIIFSVIFWDTYDPLLGLIMFAPMMFLGDTGKCILDKNSNQISFVFRETFKIKPTIKAYPISKIKNIGLVGNPYDGFSIGFKINGEWKNAINSCPLTEKKASEILGKLKNWLKCV